jgi:rhamnogalacturonyl hydrolase YesR
MASPFWEHAQREKLVAILRDVAAALGAVQDAETGLWYRVLDQGSRAGSYSSTILVRGS